MDVAAFWAQEEAKTLEERRALRSARNPSVPVSAMLPWTIHSARLPKYRDIHSFSPPALTRLPTAVFFLETPHGHSVFYTSRATPLIAASDAANAQAMAKYQASLPKEEGSVRIPLLMCLPIRIYRTTSEQLKGGESLPTTSD